MIKFLFSRKRCKIRTWRYIRHIILNQQKIFFARQNLSEPTVSTLVPDAPVQHCTVSIKQRNWVQSSHSQFKLRTRPLHSTRAIMANKFRTAMHGYLNSTGIKIIVYPVPNGLFCDLGKLQCTHYGDLLSLHIGEDLSVLNFKHAANRATVTKSSKILRKIGSPLTKNLHQVNRQQEEVYASMCVNFVCILRQAGYMLDWSACIKKSLVADSHQ